MIPQLSSRIEQHGIIPWTPFMEIGSGFDMKRWQSLPTPFEDFEAEEHETPERNRSAIQAEFHAQHFCNERELNDYLESTTAASVSYLSVASINALTGYIKSTKCDEKNMCSILRCTFTKPPEHYHKRLDYPNSTADDYLDSDLAAFKKSYGEYCITGQIRRSSFYAVVTYSSERKEDIEELSTSLGVTGSYAETQIDAGTELIRKMQNIKRSVRETHQVLVEGMQGGNAQSWLQSGTVMQAWENFLDKYEPEPHFAILRHYSSVNCMVGKVERPTGFHEVPPNVIEALWRCALLQKEAVSQSQHQEFRMTLDRFGERLGVLSTSDRKEDADEVSAILDKLGKMKDVVRRPSWLALKEEVNKDEQQYPVNQWSHEGHNTNDRTTWEWGILPQRASELGVGRLLTQEAPKVCIMPHTGKLVCQQSGMSISAPGRRIVGARLSNRYTDPEYGYSDPNHGGKWARTSDWLGRESIGFKFETQHTRGGDWELIVWTISERMYDSDAAI